MNSVEIVSPKILHAITNASDIKTIIVTPVYEDAEAFAMLLNALAALYGRAMLVVAVDDGSLAQPLNSLLMRADLDCAVIRLTRNVGHQRAIAIGLSVVSKSLRADQQIVIMDCDGEDAPASIKQLLKRLESPEVDVVVAERKSRIESWRFKMFYAIYRRFFVLMTGRMLTFGNFMALKPHAAKRLAGIPDLSIHVAGCVLGSKLRAARCQIDRGARFAGQSKMNFFSLALHGFKGLMVFAEDVLVRVGTACAAIALLSIVGAAAAVVLKLVGYSTPGWFSVALGILVLMFLQTGAITLMTLMLTGVVRGGNASSGHDYEDLIAEIIESKALSSAC